MAQLSQSDWQNPDWLEQVHQWIWDELAVQAITVTGPIDQFHIRPWSTVMRAPTNQGNVYFKASTSVCGHDTAVTQTIFRYRPDTIPAVLAVDAKRGWLLLADGGQRLREAFREEKKPMQDWSAILADYARLQMDLAGHVAEFLAGGTPDQRLARLPALYEEVLADTQWLLIDQPDGLTAAEYERLLAAVPQVTEMCRQLAGYAVPESLHHNDLHDGNIFIRDGRYLFFDWGDSSISHPFFCLRTVFISMENTFGLAENDPIFDTFGRDYWLCWRQFETELNLADAFALARKLWALSSALKYRMHLSQVVEMRAQYAGAVPSLLQEFLAANPEL
ncbi:MAG: phosphotransferase [Ardenticatenaceae bacterium]|nr:phosphotransferase [Ardenticatenaceae bacterium]